MLRNVRGVAGGYGSAQIRVTKVYGDGPPLATPAVA